MREVFFLVGEGDVILWADVGDSPVRIPDSRTRWEAIWARRHRVIEIAHSHPIGPLAFSREDETTMRAIVAALGRPVRFSVVAPHGMVRRTEATAPGTPAITIAAREPWWTNLLRLASGMLERNESHAYLRPQHHLRRPVRRLPARRRHRAHRP